MQIWIHYHDCTVGVIAVLLLEVSIIQAAVLQNKTEPRPLRLHTVLFFFLISFIEHKSRNAVVLHPFPHSISKRSVHFSLRRKLTLQENLNLLIEGTCESPGMGGGVLGRCVFLGRWIPNFSPIFRRTSEQKSFKSQHCRKINKHS